VAFVAARIWVPCVSAIVASLFALPARAGPDHTAGVLAAIQECPEGDSARARGARRVRL